MPDGYEVRGVSPGFDFLDLSGRKHGWTAAAQGIADRGKVVLRFLNN